MRCSQWYSYVSIQGWSPLISFSCTFARTVSCPDVFLLFMMNSQHSSTPFMLSFSLTRAEWVVNNGRSTQSIFLALSEQAFRKAPGFHPIFRPAPARSFTFLPSLLGSHLYLQQRKVQLLHPTKVSFSMVLWRSTGREIAGLMHAKRLQALWTRCT